MNFNNVEFESSYGNFSQLPKSECIEIAFAGRSNVGKSSMINKVFNRKRLARVSSMPGKTVTINFFKIENVRFADLPGYGYAKASKTEQERWSKLIEAYFNSDRRLELVFQLIDIRHAPTEKDVQMINYLVETERPFVIVLTKKDKLSKSQFIKRMEELKTEIPYADELTMVPFSAENGEGVDEIKSIIEYIAASEDDSEEDETDAENDELDDDEIEEDAE